MNHAPRPRRRTAGLGVALGCATVAAFAGVTGPAAAGEEDAAAALRRDTAAVHRAGAVGVTAVLDTPDSTATAHAGTADLATGAPALPDARFRAGSTAKPFVATVALQLTAEGALSLDDTVEEWLPGLVAGNGHDGTRVTVRDLLQQTSGLPDYLVRPDVLPAFHSAEGFRAHHLRRYTDEELVEGALRSPREFEPGTGWGYSNTNYVLAGLIVERAAGDSWEREVRERVIEPLGLEDTEVPEDDPYPSPPFLSGHHVFPEGGDPVDTTVFHPSAASAGGALVSTPGDIDRFLTALVDGELLPPEQLAEMLTARDTGREGVGYGLGLFARDSDCGGTYWGHSGTLLGYHNENGVTPDGERAVTVATNSFDFADGAAQDRVDAAMADLVERALCAD